MTTYHPRKDNGKLVPLKHPQQPTSMDTWANPSAVATATPDSSVPAVINGIEAHPWLQAPKDSAGWEQLAQTMVFDEPPMKVVAGKGPASGAVVVEADGRVWVVSPINGFGGYANTFPKGKLDLKEGLTLRGNALKEVFEESGLQVCLTGFLCDSIRSTSTTRYYLARRIGGSPSAMGWESEAVHLIPAKRLPSFTTHVNDQPVVEAVLGLLSKPVTRADILATWTLTSAQRILYTMAGFRRKYGRWPDRVLKDAGMADAIKREVLTPLGWALLAIKVDLVKIDRGTVIAEGVDGARYEYGDTDSDNSGASDASQWVWGLDLVN